MACVFSCHTSSLQELNKPRKRSQRAEVLVCSQVLSRCAANRKQALQQRSGFLMLSKRCTHAGVVVPYVAPIIKASQGSRPLQGGPVRLRALLIVRSTACAIACL